MAAFSSAAFNTDAFSVAAFDFGDVAPAATAVVGRPAGGWETGKIKRDLFFTPRLWTVSTQEGVKHFDTPGAASQYLADLKEAERLKGIKKARRIGKAAQVEYAGVPVNDMRVHGKTGAQILAEQNMEMLMLLQRIIERQLQNQAMEEEEILLMLASAL